MLRLKKKKEPMGLMQPSVLFTYCMGMDNILGGMCVWGCKDYFFLVFFFSFTSRIPFFNIAFIFSE